MAKKSVIKTVSRNLREAKKQTKSVSRAISKKRSAAAQKQSKLQSKRSYSMRDLPDVKGRTFAQLVHSIRQHEDELNRLIKPGEMWAFELGSDDTGWNKSYQLFDSIDLMVDKLDRYETAQKVGNKNNKAGREWVEAIKIVKIGRPLKDDEDDESHYMATVDKYRKSKLREVKRRKEKQSKVITGASEFAKKRGEKKLTSKIDIIESLLNTAKGMEKMLEDANNRIAQLEKLVKKAQPKSKSKKQQPKRQAAKQVVKRAKHPAKKSTKRPQSKPVAKARAKKTVKQSRPTKKVQKKKAPSKSVKKTKSSKKGVRK